MLRLNDETKHNYIRKCCESASNIFISDNKVTVDGLIISGAGGMKNKFHDSNVLDPRLKEKVLTLITVGNVYKDAFNDSVKLSEHYLLQFKQNKEDQVLNNYYHEIESINNKTCFGINDTLYCLKSKLIDTLILSHNLEMNVITARNKKDRYQSLTMFVTNNEMKNNSSTPTSRLVNNIKYGNNGWDGWYIISSVNFTEWLFINNNYKQFGVKKIEIINGNNRKNNEFYDNYGGIGGLLHLSVDLVQLNENDEKNEIYENNGINCNDIGKTIWIINEPKPILIEKDKSKEINNNDNKGKNKKKGKVKVKAANTNNKKKKPIKKTKASEASKKFLEFKKRREKANKSKEYVFTSSNGNENVTNDNVNVSVECSARAA